MLRAPFRRIHWFLADRRIPRSPQRRRTRPGLWPYTRRLLGADKACRHYNLHVQRDSWGDNLDGTIHDRSRGREGASVRVGVDDP
jgi:hypothetical protein